jgi:hypothetical protein
MSAADLAGWCAAALTLGTFICRDMLFLRALAICANAAFITYGAVSWLMPVLVLHLALAPVNAWRLLELIARKREQRAQAPAPQAPAPGTASPVHAMRRAARIHLAGCSSPMRCSRPLQRGKRTTSRRAYMRTAQR